MTDFRHKLPIRRVTPAYHEKYTDYKQDLKEDFNERCGYCGDHDFFRMTYYEIDHFVPRGKWKKIKENDYSNLVYSCRSCNNSKRAKWPSGDELVHNDGQVGFIDPCCEEYANQFIRGKDGSIIATTSLGKWMWKALNFGNPVHRITWVLEELQKNMEALIELRKSGVVDVRVNEGLARLIDLYFMYEKQLKGTPRF